MNRRTIILIVVAVGMVVLYGMDHAYRSLIERPMKLNERKLSKLNSNLSKAQDAQLQGSQASQKLERLAQHSLPADPELARSAYQDWLLEQVNSHGLDNASVDPGQPIPVTIRSRINSDRRRLVFHRLGFNLSARGSLDQITRFMFDFYRAAHLHKVRSIALNPLGREQLVDFTLSIEAIALSDCEREGELAEGTLDRLAFAAIEPYQYISRRNMFARGFSKALAEVELTALTVDRTGTAQAWFAVGPQRTTQIISPGEKLVMELHDTSLIDVQGDTAIVQIDGTLVRVACGQTLGQAMASNDSPADEGEITVQLK